MRQVATHIYAKEILDGQYEEREGWEPNILHCARGEVSRVNVLGALIRQNGQLVLDDGTGQLHLRAFDDVPGLKTPDGTVVQVIGRPREYQGTYYLVIEIIKPVDPAWARVRKAELGEPLSYEKKPALEQQESSPAQEQPVDNKAEHVIDVIGSLDEGEGAAIQDVIDEAELGDVTEHIINQLLLDGEIFEIKPGVVKVL